MGCSPSRESKPKLFTDFIHGGSKFFNNVMRWFAADSYNLFTPNHATVTATTWDIQSEPISGYNATTKLHVTIGPEFPARKFVMDQYSCMNEGHWLHKYARSIG